MTTIHQRTLRGEPCIVRVRVEKIRPLSDGSQYNALIELVTRVSEGGTETAVQTAPQRLHFAATAREAEQRALADFDNWLASQT